MRLQAAILTFLVLGGLAFGLFYPEISKLSAGIQPETQNMDTVVEHVEKAEIKTPAKTKKPYKSKLSKQVSYQLKTEERSVAPQGFKINSDILKFVVFKSRQKMRVYFGDTFKTFNISLGGNPIGDKKMQGDKRTPEGHYFITFKNPKSRGYKSLKVSYPDAQDMAEARSSGVNPGGDIFIHGLWWPQQDPATHWRDNWTNGCIAVNNSEIDEIYKHTLLKTPIQILP